MPINWSGSVSLNDVQTNFGGTNPIGMNEYYRGGSNVTNTRSDDGGNSSVPTSGQISMSQFRGTLGKGSAIWMWGINSNGSLGQNTGSVNRSSPVLVVGGITDWVQFSAGTLVSHGIRANGTLYGWGYGPNGRIGDGTVVNRSSPVLVAGGFTDWVEVADCSVGGFGSNSGALTFGRRSNGTLYGWGRNVSFQVGDGTNVARSSPVLVTGGITDWVQVSAGLNHGVALRANGTLYSWGPKTFGVLGNNDASYGYVSSPGLVVGGFTDWTKVTAGTNTSMATRSNGTLYAWGYGSYGRLGDGNAVNRSSPVLVVGGFTDWVQPSMGSSHSAAVRSNGTIWSWGDNSYGVLGNNDGSGFYTTQRSSPVSVVGGITDWVQVTAGVGISMGLRANGTLYSWGRNNFGQLGDGTVVNRSSPTLVVGGISNWVQCSMGRFIGGALRRA